MERMAPKKQKGGDNEIIGFIKATALVTDACMEDKQMQCNMEVLCSIM